MKLKNTFGKYAWKVLMLMALLNANKEVQAQSEQPLDTLIDGMDTIYVGKIDTSDIGAFESDYFVTDLLTINEPDIDLNAVLGVDKLTLGETYTANIRINNTNNYKIKGLSPIVSCDCISVDYPKNPINPGGTGDFPIKIVPTTPAIREIIVKIPIVKEGVKPIIIGDRTIKIIFNTKEN